jgi:hypothetical protein
MKTRVIRLDEDLITWLDTLASRPNDAVRELKKRIESPVTASAGFSFSEATAPTQCTSCTDALIRLRNAEARLLACQEEVRESRRVEGVLRSLAKNAVGATKRSNMNAHGDFSPESW